MNGIERITARLEADAQAEIDALNGETAAQCEAIRAEYAAKAQAEYEKRVKEGTKSCELRAQRLESTAEMEAKKSILAFKQEMVSAAFTAAAEKMIHMPKEEYVAFLASQAAKAVATGEEVLIFNSRDAGAVGEAVAKKANALLKEKGLRGSLSVSAETRDIPGGVIVKQGDIEVNCSVDTLVQLYRDQLASQVAEILFA